MSKIRILIVEDERIIAEDIKVTLQKLNYEIAGIVATGEEAIVNAGELHPDIILMDILLETAMDGIEAAEKIQTKHDIPVIFLTAHADNKTLQRVTSSDFYGYILKPFKDKELHATINMAINKHNMERRIKESKERYKIIFKNIQDVYFEIDLSGVIREISYSVENILEIKRKDLIGKSFFAYFQTSSDRFIYELKKENTIQEFEVNLKDEHHNIVPCSINARLFNDDNGRPEKIIGSMRNISKRKVAEEQATRLAEEWKVTFDSINDMVTIQDNDFNIVKVNKAVLEAFDKKPEEVIGKKCYEFFNNRNEPLPSCPFIKAKEEGKTITDEFYISSLKKTFEISTSPIYDNEENFIGIVHLAKDITEKKSIERTLLELKKAIETMQLGVTITNIDGKIIYTNATEANMHGFTVEELIGKDVGIFSSPELRKPLTIDEINHLHGWIRESKNMKKDGTLFPVRLMSDVVHDNDGKIIGVVTTCEDLTEHKGKEKALMELRKAIETLHLGVTITDLYGRIIYTNYADAKMHGYEIKDLIGKDVGIFSPSALRKPLGIDQIKNLKGLIHESFNIRRDGSIFPVRIMSDVVKDEMGNPIAVVTTCEDITERKKAEEEVKRLAAIVESSEDAIIGKTLEGIIISWNKGAERIYGYKSEEIKGLSAQVLSPKSKKDEIKLIIRKVIKGAKFENFETVRRRKNGDLFYVSLTVSPIKDATGRIIGVSTIARDITEKKMAELAIKESEKKFRRIFENIQDVYFEVDYDGNIKELSPSINLISKWSREDLVGKSMDEIYREPAQRLKLLKQIKEKGRINDYEIELKDKDGEIIPCSITAILNFENGKPDRLIGSMRNISERKEAEQEIRRAKEYAELLYRVVPSPIFTVDEDHIVTSWNDKAEEITGYKAEEIIGKECTTFALDPCNDKCGLFSEDVPKPIVCKECLIRTKDGRQRVISKNADILKDINGNFIGGIESFEDITDRKIAEEKLRKSEEKYRHLVENLENEYFFYEHDKKRAITYVSPSIKNILGYTQEEFMQHHLEYLADSEVNRRVANFTQLCLEGKQQPTYKAEIYDNDGVIHILEISEFPVVDENGKVVGVQGIGHDITERIKAENRLKNSEKRFKDISLSIGDWIWEIDKNAKYTFCSEKVKNILGYKTQEVIGRSPFSFMTKECAADLSKEFAEISSKKENFYDMEHINIHKNGEIVYLSASGIPILDESGNLLGYRGVDKDITEKKKAEEVKNQLLKKLEQANKELKDFAYIVSHDLKAPLRAISTLAGWISQDYADKFDEDGKEQMELLISRVGRMHKLIEGVLLYSRVGRIVEEKAQIDLDEITKEVIDMLAPPENIKISIENKLPTVVFEPTRIQQVIQNLISNAIKYMDKPEGVIKIGSSEEKGFWKFYVADNGPGIDKKYFEKIFQIFQTLHARDEVDSTGVGLTTVKKIIEMYGGKIWVESEVGKGSTFFFTIPKENQ